MKWIIQNMKVIKNKILKNNYKKGKRNNFTFLIIPLLSPLIITTIAKKLSDVEFTESLRLDKIFKLKNKWRLSKFRIYLTILEILKGCLDKLKF
jgi:hypothetical protein